jgi:hypothetical protein
MWIFRSFLAIGVENRSLDVIGKGLQCLEWRNNNWVREMSAAATLGAAQRRLPKVDYSTFVLPFPPHMSPAE